MSERYPSSGKASKLFLAPFVTEPTSTETGLEKRQDEQESPVSFIVNTIKAELREKRQENITSAQIFFLQYKIRKKTKQNKIMLQFVAPVFGRFVGGGCWRYTGEPVEKWILATWLELL